MKTLKEALVHKHMDKRSFPKDDLELGDIVITRGGCIMQLKYSKIFKTNIFNYVDKLSSGSCWLNFHLDWYDDNLTHIGMSGDEPYPYWDVMEVYRCDLDLPIDLKEHKELKHKLDKMRPIWERK